MRKNYVKPASPRDEVEKKKKGKKDRKEKSLIGQLSEIVEVGPEPFLVNIEDFESPIKGRMSLASDSAFNPQDVHPKDMPTPGKRRAKY